MSYTEHKELSRDTPVTCAVITVSDTRTRATDKSGPLMISRLEEAGHTVAAYHIIPDDGPRIQSVLNELSGTVEAVILNGGTGISKRDGTFEALSAMFEKTLPGFGELFRMLSFEEIGPGAMLSRATAGVYKDTLIFSTPGSSNAVKLAIDRLIVPELKHLVWEIIRQQK